MSPHYVAYARKSSESEDRQILSIPEQLTELRELAVRLGITIATELTESASAREPGRPVFSELLREVKTGHVAGILCWKLDRLARNMVDGGQIIYFLGNDALQEVVTTEGRYSGSPESKFMMAMLFGAATKMTDDLSVAVKRGNRAVYELGRIPGNPPLGYVKEHDGASRRGAARVVPDPERFELVQRLWLQMLEGTSSVAGLWREASIEWGLTSRPTAHQLAKPISIGTVYALLRNPFYAGQVVRAGKTYRGEHARMVTKTEFARVQQLLEHDDRLPRPTTPFLYQGLLVCGRCGRHLTGERITNRQGHTYTYYRCTRRRVGYPACHASAPDERRVTEDILDALQHVAVDPVLFRSTTQALTWLAERDPTSPVALVRSGERALARAEHELATLTDLLIGGYVEQQEYAVRRTAQLAKIDHLRGILAEPAASLEAWRVAREGWESVGHALVAAFRDGSATQKRELLTRTCTQLVVTCRKTALTLRTPYQFSHPKASISA